MTYLTQLFAAIRRREEGQTMAEYGVILAVITVLIIGALLFLSSGIERNIMSVGLAMSARCSGLAALLPPSHRSGREMVTFPRLPLSPRW